MKEREIVVFSYGSNMFSSRIRERCPSAKTICVGKLQEYILRWDKIGKDGSGKCDAELTGRSSDVIWGVLISIDASEKKLLDGFEGLGHGYDEKTVTLSTDRGDVSAVIYFATRKNPQLKPFSWYKDLVIAGAKQHALPIQYIARLEVVEATPDSDVERNRIHRLLLNLKNG